MSDLFPETVVPLTKTWLPVDYLDEIIPDTLENPDGWIVAFEGAYYLASEDDTGEPDLDRPLTDGQIVKFNWTANLASGVVTVKLGSYGNRVADLSINEPTPPLGAHMYIWIPGDPESMASSLTDFIADLDLHQEHDVQFYVWSDDIPFTFQGGKFLPAEANAAEG